MPNSDYEFIKEKIRYLKDTYPSLRQKSDAYVFSALSIKAHYYKSPAFVLTDKDFEDFIVDGQYDGGVDILLSDPNSEESDLVIGQSKFYQKIASDDVVQAVTKMVFFYKDMIAGHYEQVNEKVQSHFLSLYSEVGEESRIQFVFYSSAPQNKIQSESITRKFRELLPDSNRFDLIIMFGSDIEREIKESESRRTTIESGKIRIDDRNNYLLYKEDAAIVNVSAFSIKELYARHNTNLLAQNLRYYIKIRNIDVGIQNTIKENPESFWLKNNGITIICDDFYIDGIEVKLKNFSIVNGGQTTYLISKDKNISEKHDFYLPCKVIKTSGTNEDEKIRFSLEIAKATNSQKAIKPADLKSNSPEQVRFSQAMRGVGIFYETKRGETIPEGKKEDYQHSNLTEIGKLGLAAIFQMPATSRNKPSSLYDPQYYNIIFDGNQSQIAELCKELLYIDYYFRKKFKGRFELANKNQPDSSDRLAIAHNARTICIAFVALASRYYNKNIDNDSLQIIFNASKSDNRSKSDNNEVYEVVRNMDRVNHILPKSLFANKGDYDEVLYKLFVLIINAGSISYSIAKRYEDGLNATNYLKKDKNYYSILQSHWSTLSVGVQSIFDSIS